MTPALAACCLGHTLDDQAETVLLGLARGSGPSSLSGMESRSGLWLRPLLGLRRSATEGFCADSGLAPWHDPQNDDPAFTRVRVRRTLLPLLEQELGPGVIEALGRTADQLREDSAALDHFAEEQAEDLADHAEAGISLTVSGARREPARPAPAAHPARRRGGSSRSRSAARRRSRWPAS